MSRFFKMLLLTIAVAVPASSWAQGKIAVVNLEEAMLQTDEAQKRLNDLRTEEDYEANKKEFDRLKTEHDELIKNLQNDIAVMSPEQQQEARKKLTNKQSDLEHVLRKLKQAEQEMGQTLLQEMTPKVQAVLRDIIASESIGLLLQRSSVIHADPGFSITAKVTDKLNQLAVD